MSSLLLSTSRLLQRPNHPTLSAAIFVTRGAHSRTKVRVIIKEDLPNGQAYTGDILHVPAGYARNYLLPKKSAVYATRENFAKLGLQDPELLSGEQQQKKKAGDLGNDQDLKAADLLRNYLRNKTVRCAGD